VNRYVEALLEVPQGLRLLTNPFDAFTHVLGIHGGKNVTYKLRSGQQFLIPTAKSHRPSIMTINEIFGENCYPVSNGGSPVIVDIGAQAGIFVIYALFRNPNARLTACEPMPENCDLIKCNLKLNFPGKPPRVTLVESAVMDVPGTVKLNVDRTSSRAHSVLIPRHGAISVSATTLSDLFEKHAIEECDYLKIDTEGAEYPILYNCPEDVLLRVKNLYIECHPLRHLAPNYCQSAMAEFVAHRGFEIVTQHKKIIRAKRR
jgi:FkbM family methyltransferase